MKPLTFSSTDLALLHDQLDSWRQRQGRRVRLPPELWEAAAKLAATHGVSPVARALRIGFYRLQRRARELPLSGSVSSAPNRFVELQWEVPPPPAHPASGWVELIDGPHRRMRLHTGHDPAAWVALARSFWRTAR
jgi:hypothetical protein